MYTQGCGTKTPSNSVGIVNVTSMHVKIISLCVLTLILFFILFDIHATFFVWLRGWRFWEVYHFQAGKMFILSSISIICIYDMIYVDKASVSEWMKGLDIYLDVMQIKLLFQSGFDEAELKGYTPVIHANVYQTIKVWIWKGVLVVSPWLMLQFIYSMHNILKWHSTVCWSCMRTYVVIYYFLQILHDGSKELSQSLEDSSKFIISDENKVCNIVPWQDLHLFLTTYEDLVSLKMPYWVRS